MQNDNIDFSTVLASAVHDMKNSLCMLIQSIDTISQNEKFQGAPESQELANLHYEAFRLNTNLLQLLSLYRVEKKQLPINIEEQFIDDICTEVISINELYSKNKNITIETDIQSDLAWYFDSNLITNLLNDIFVNALRYTKDKIKLSAYEENDRLIIRVEDNGEGYPQEMLEITSMPMQELNLNSGRTGLGLFFARMIAQGHRNNGKTGEIKLENGSGLGGSTFTLSLP